MLYSLKYYRDNDCSVKEVDAETLAVKKQSCPFLILRNQQQRTQVILNKTKNQQKTKRRFELKTVRWQRNKVSLKTQTEPGS